MNSTDLNNLLQAIGIAVAIILFILSIIIGYWLFRRKANKKYFDICGKSTSRVKIKEMLPDRPDHKYYYTREVDNSILEAMKKKKGFIVIGRPLAGKTRAVYEAFRKSKKKYSLYKINSNTKINRDDFKIPKNLFFRFRERMLFIDDIHRFTEQENFDFVLLEANKNKVIISATCRNGDFGIDVYKRNMNSKNLNVESYASKEFIIPDISNEIINIIKKKFGNELKNVKSDGTIGSLFMPLQEMTQRYKDCTEEEKIILQSIKEMYITGICYGMNIFPEEWVKVLSEYNGLKKDDAKWKVWIKQLIKTELILFIKPENHIRAEEVYLDGIILEILESNIKIFKKMLLVYEKNDEALIFLAFKSHSMNTELSANDYFEISIEAFTKSFNIHNEIDNNTDCAFDLINRGFIYNESKFYDKAIEDFTRAIELKPDLAEAYVNRGNAYSELQEYDKAIAEFNIASELKPDIAEIFYNRGIVYSNIQSYDKAITDYTKTIILEPDFLEAYYNRGKAYFDLEKFEEAIADFTKTVEIKPDYSDAYYSRGLIYAKDKKEYLKAINDFSKAIEHKPDLADGYNNRGNTFAVLEQYQDAIADFSKSIKIEPLEASKYNNRGIAYYNLKKYDEAIKDWEKAIELNPDYESKLQKWIDEAKENFKK